MTELSLQRASAGSLGHCTLSFPPGLHVVLGHEREGSADLVDLISGSRAPRSGSVRVGGAAPHRSPALRLRLVALRREEELFPARSVGEAVGIALAARGLALTAAGVLDRFRLSQWAARRVSKLDWRERRVVALCIALSVEQPVLAVFHEPLAYLPGLSPELVTSRIASWVARGCLVVCTTSSPTAAQVLGGTVWMLERGSVRPVLSSGGIEPLPGYAVTLLIRTPRARELAAALSGAPGITAAGFDEALQRSQVRVQGSDPTLGLTIARVARELDVPIEAMVPSLPDLEVTRAANAGYLRATYEAAYHRAQWEQQSTGGNAHARS